MKKYVLISWIAIITFLLFAFKPLHTNGIAGYTNSPGESSCNSCHLTYPLNSQGGHVSISVANASNYYIPGQTYTVSVKIVRPGFHLFGFGFEALDSLGANSGTLSIVDVNSTILIDATVNSVNRTNVTHYQGNAATDSNTFIFLWKAPIEKVGKVFFYTSANASNYDGFSYGDYIYASSQVLYPAVNTTSVNKQELDPQISIFPNPTSGRFQIETGEPSKHKVDFYDNEGNRVLSKVVENKTTVEATELNDGIYTLSLDLGTTQLKRKLIIRH